MKNFKGYTKIINYKLSIMRYVIEKINVDDVYYYGKDKYNSNNHWKSTCDTPEDYIQVLEKTETKHWIDKFHRYYTILNIDKSDLAWMKDAVNISSITSKISGVHKDEIERAIQKYEKHIGHLFKHGEKYFVRSDTVSLKEGIHGVGPYTNVKMIIESLVSCKTGHSPVEVYTEDVKLYLMKWQENLVFHKEFRVFVQNRRITAISQQHLYTVNNILAPLSEEDREKLINEWITTINTYFEDVIKDKITVLDSYVMDIAILDHTNEAYFIEINAFGKDYSSGSSLFHWIIDDIKLMGKVKDTIFFRYAV